MCLPLQGAELIIPHGDRSTETQHWQHLYARFGAPFLLYSLLELSIKDVTVLEFPVNYICHKHGLLGGFPKATHFFPDFVLTIFHSPTGYGAASPWGWGLSQVHCTFFTTQTGKNHSSQISPQWQHWKVKDWCWRCLEEETGISESQNFGSTTPLLKHSLLPQSFRISTQNIALMCSPTCNALFLLSHTYLSAFIWVQNVLYKSGEIDGVFFKHL